MSPSKGGVIFTDGVIEGAGAISRWRLEFPSTERQFDYDSISDVIVHISYTAGEDELLIDPVNAHVSATLDQWLQEVGGSGPGLVRMLSLRQEFAHQLHRFLHPTASQSAHEISFTLEDLHFGHLLREYLSDGRLYVESARVVVNPAAGVAAASFDGAGIELGLASLLHQPMLVDSGAQPAWGGLPAATFAYPSGPAPTGAWTLRLDPAGDPADAEGPMTPALTPAGSPEIVVDVDGQTRLRPEAIDDIAVVLVLRISP